MDSPWRKKEDEEEETRAKPSRRSSVGTKNVVGKAGLRLMRSMAKAFMERKPSSATWDQTSKVVVKEDDRCSEKGSERALRLPMEGRRSMMINMAAGRLSNVQEDEKRVVVVAELQRRSVSEVEAVNAESVAAAASVRVMAVDMPPFMQVHAFRCARRAYHGSEQSFSTRHIAFTIKKEFDKIYGPAWHCIVGSSFGSYVTHATGCFIYFSLDQLFVLLFKTKVQRLIAG